MGYLVSHERSPARIEIFGRSGLRYTDVHGRSLRSDGEMRVGKISFAIYSKTLHWEDSGEAVEEGDKERILEEIRKIFIEHGLELAVE